MTQHTITAHEPYMHETEFTLTDDGIAEKPVDQEKAPNWESLASYECSCGAEFDDLDEAIDHLYQ